MTGSELRALRQEMGLSQSQLAGKLGYRASTIADYEHGRKEITQALEKHMLLLLEAWRMKKLFDDS